MRINQFSYISIMLFLNLFGATIVAFMAVYHVLVATPRNVDICLIHRGLEKNLSLPHESIVMQRMYQEKLNLPFFDKSFVETSEWRAGRSKALGEILLLDTKDYLAVDCKNVRKVINPPQS